ncbi:MAG TPA: NAD(P)-dependent oxidoreductase [Actinocrinis sp.]|jgi:nucleoside-diphosphate-sugar epimerase|uniref:NAD-dependent epimerase/dehydratase family protein n=1 Tax=Actinocrinis sp. TaxID=1920516 RepID=UPI002DDD7105|nr:NAD(P)-dependent oxidoreductase [Actinocrinis sp.]HEV3169375.1 NAD(P)-dependent oxidoreductase [Actinocrinis sp.]
MRVFVAGATGVLGTAAVRRLVAGGHKVTGIARTPVRRQRLVAAGATPVDVDLFDPGAVHRALEHHDVVCNLATRIPVGTAALRTSSWRENDRIRTEGSAVLAKAAADCGVLRLIQEAVAFAYADAGEEWVTEKSPIAPSPRLRSSLEATENAMGFADQYRFAVVLRFGLFYGADANTQWLLERVRRGKPVLLGEPSGYISPIAVDDAAAAVVAALAAPSGIYNVAGAPVHRTEWARALGTAAGVDGSAKFVPALTRRVLGGKATDPLARSLRISSDAFRTATGWRARTPLAEGFASAVKAR